MQAYWSADGWTWRTSNSITQPLNWGDDSYHSGSGWPGFPVTGVSWYEAEAYPKYAGKRLPTEAEWEFAARGGMEGKRFAWGDELCPNGKHMANVWQGQFPYERKTDDGFLYTSPVKSFPPNGYGLYDMIGNVWEWCADWYRGDYYATLTKDGKIAINPTGPADSYDPDESYSQKRVNRGGSFLCNSQYCASYRPSARMKTSPDSAMSNLGFRCVMSDAAWRAKLGKGK